MPGSAPAHYNFLFLRLFSTTNLKVNSLKLKVFILICFSWLNASGQQGLFLGAGFTDAFNSRDIMIYKKEIGNLQTYGYRADVFYNYPLSSFDIRLGAGFKQLFFSGTYDLQNFSGNTTKAGIFLKGFYTWGDNWKGGLGISMENNRDLKNFRSQTTDLWRYNAELEINYLLQPGLFLTLNYSKALSPYVDFYLLSNPADQLSLGVIYKLPWL